MKKLTLVTKGNIKEICNQLNSLLYGSRWGIISKNIPCPITMENIKCTLKDNVIHINATNMYHITISGELYIGDKINIDNGITLCYHDENNIEVHIIPLEKK